MDVPAGSSTNWSEAERSLLTALDELLGREEARGAIARALPGVLARLEREPGAPMAWEPLPLSIYGAGVPPGIRSSWIFVLRARTISGAERHPNSHQRVIAYHGAGDLQAMPDGEWVSHLLTSDPGAPLERRWASLPPGTWHQAVTGEEHWTVVSFHTAAAEALIEERPGEADPAETRRRTYLGESRRDR